ncbi:thiosulfate oxidation carrier protein SoxY [Rhizobiales bacterium]|nr:thiosulfate oxidation carrier protein SoxY [Hongsoonwoonella zoysiae]NRG19309.1 thiosulfate oxidation carrier protein SoxY [Hongsoonwoonella zoysiae]
MELNRRQIMALGVGSAAFATTMSLSLPALAANDAQALINAFTGGAEAGEGALSLDAPEIAENGNTVPIEVTVDSPMTDDDYVEAVLIVANGNPNASVATFHFTPMSGEALASTRIRLAKTQDVIAVARMSNGTFAIDRKTVKVTIGGCGG